MRVWGWWPNGPSEARVGAAPAERAGPRQRRALSGPRSRVPKQVAVMKEVLVSVLFEEAAERVTQEAKQGQGQG